MLSACGIQSFWTDQCFTEHSEGVSPVNIFLTAKIKGEPEDFLVVEIDPNGQRTDCENYQFFNPPAADGADSNTEFRKDKVVVFGSGVTNGEESEEGFIENQLQNTDCGIISVDETTSSQISLSCCIISILQELEVLIKRDHFEASIVADRAARLTAEELPFLIEYIRTGRPSSAAHWWEKEWLLSIPGSYSMDKIHRGVFHNFIRLCFKHIRPRMKSASEIFTTSSSAHASGEAGVPPESQRSGLQFTHIFFAIDPHYIFFTFLFGRKVAETLIEWARLHQQESITLKTPNVKRECQAIEQYLCTRQETPSFITSAASSSFSSTYLGVSFETHFRSPFFSLDDNSRSSTNQVNINADRISEKDVRRSFHDYLRRFYPFIKCHVKDGKFTFKRLLKHQLNVWKRPRSSVYGEGEEIVDGQSCQYICSDELLRYSNGSDNARKEYTYFVVFKRNLDVIEMKQLLAQYFHVHTSCVSTAGLKDKVAITYQRVSVSGWSSNFLSPDENHPTPQGMILPWPSDPQRSYARIHRISPKPYSLPLQIGHLRGNYFVIRLRQVKILHDVRGTTALGLDNSPQSIRDLTIRTLQERFQRVCLHGFINYFGQQRFSESIADIQDHTGLHLFAGRWPEAVKSLYRPCPQVYEAFPDAMEVRHVPKNARDAQIMTHALFRTYRMYFSEHLLTRADVQEKSALWSRICHKAITEFVPFALRSMWVHAAQSLHFNVIASYVAKIFLSARSKHQKTTSASHSDSDIGFNMRAAQDLKLPLGGYHIREERNDSTSSHSPVGEGQPLWLSEAERHALEVLALSQETIFGQSKVAGVPVPESWRRLIVIPEGAHLEIISKLQSSEVSDSDTVDAVLSFSLPSSSYATICLREILHNNNWF